MSITVVAAVTGKVCFTSMPVVGSVSDASPLAGMPQAQARSQERAYVLSEEHGTTRRPGNKSYHTAALSRLHNRSLPRAAVLYLPSRETSGTLRECQGRRSSETVLKCGEQSGLGARVKCYGAPQAENMTGKRKPQWLRPQSQPSYLAWGVREGCFLVHHPQYLGRQAWSQADN